MRESSFFGNQAYKQACLLSLGGNPHSVQGSIVSNTDYVELQVNLNKISVEHSPLSTSSCISDSDRVRMKNITW